MNVHRLDLGITTCYLLVGRNGHLLIDTGYAKDYGRFTRALARIGVELSEIRYLFLTHHHDDHAGFAAELRSATRCTILAHRDAVAPLARGASEEGIVPVTRRVRLVFGFFQLFHRTFAYPPVELGEDDLVLSGDDAEVLPRLGFPGTVLHTPGHTRDSLSVLLPDGSAFVGDAAMNFLAFTGIRHRPIYVEHATAVFDSWRSLLAHGARTIYPAHGRPFDATRLANVLGDLGTS